MSPDKIHKLTDAELDVVCAERIEPKPKGRPTWQPGFEDFPIASLRRGWVYCYTDNGWGPAQFTQDYAAAHELEDKIEWQGVVASYMSALRELIKGKMVFMGLDAREWQLRRATPRQIAEAFAACMETVQ